MTKNKGQVDVVVGAAASPASLLAPGPGCALSGAAPSSANVPAAAGHPVPPPGRQFRDSGWRCPFDDQCSAAGELLQLLGADLWSPDRRLRRGAAHLGRSLCLASRL